MFWGKFWGLEKYIFSDDRMVNTDGSLTIWTKSINMNEKKKKSFIEFMEEHPELFYDTTELDGLDNAVGNDSGYSKNN